MPEPKPVPAAFLDPLINTAGMGISALSLPITTGVTPMSGLPIPATTVNSAETTSERRKRNYNVTMGNPLFIGSPVSPEQAARMGRGMLNYLDTKLESKLRSIPKNLLKSAVKGQFNPVTVDTEAKVGVEVVKALAKGEAITASKLAGWGTRIGASAVEGAVVGALASPITMGDATIDGNRWRFDMWKAQDDERVAKAKTLDDEYAKKMKNKYPSVEVLFEQPMWKRDVFPNFTEEEKKIRSYEGVLEQRFRKAQADGAEQARLENGFYNDKGEFMSAHFLRNTK